MSIYNSYTPDQLEEHFSNFIIKSWSFSKLNQYVRNEKAFEMIYIYGYQNKSAASGVSGNAYHLISDYWKAKQKGLTLSLPELQETAFKYIEEVPANKWKLQKTTPTIADAKIKAIKTTTALLGNFYREKSKYEDHISKILDVELAITVYVTINGVDIPLPCNVIIDQVIENHEGKVIIIDHKSKNSFTSEEELRLSIGKQGITYVKAYEAYTGRVVDEVWFCENKYSQNRSGEDQLNMFRVLLTEDTRALYEDLLYENVKRLIEAVSNPDYVYLINDSDTLVDRAELYEFWAKTRITEIDEFDIDYTEVNQEMIKNRHRKIRDSSTKMITPKIIKQFKSNAASFIKYDLSTLDMKPQQKVEHILKTFGIHTQVAHIFNGYSSNTFLLEVSAGTRLSSIFSYRLDIANALNVPNVRISKDLKVHEGKSYIALDYAKTREKDLIWNKDELQDMKIPLGKDNFGNTLFWDIKKESTANKFTSGSIGSGKSVSLISDLEYALLIDDIKKIVIFDPKMEFTQYSDLLKVTVYNEYIDIENGMKALVDEMQLKVKEKRKEYVLVIIDEYADILGNVRQGKELDIMKLVQDGFYAPKKNTPPQPKMKMKKVGEIDSFEKNFMLLSQKGRSSGFRISAATQLATAEVLNSKIKVNYPVVVCFRMPKEINSRVAIDESGAEILTGEGDGLVKSPSYPEVVRFQAFFKPEEATA
ncbi:DNA translocase FtsK [Chryseobacterium indologenes]|uniref:DNA translocase FtsK n=1 Tax=Chryseobacterium indologenes TaxID=253 RepID=UPI001F4B24E1|nr:DNA translocase FtsK [Chryseobacterium indologenes]